MAWKQDHSMQHFDGQLSHVTLPFKFRTLKTPVFKYFLISSIQYQYWITLAKFRIRWKCHFQIVQFQWTSAALQHSHYSGGSKSKLPKPNTSPSQTDLNGGQLNGCCSEGLTIQISAIHILSVFQSQRIQSNSACTPHPSLLLGCTADFIFFSFY